MEQVLSSSIVFGCNEEYSPFLYIYFKEGSISNRIFGSFIYGKFVNPLKDCPVNFLDSEEAAYIEVPKWGQKKELALALKIALYFKGVPSQDIDLAKTFPSLN